MTSNVTHNLPNYLPDKNPDSVEKDVRKWVESIGEFKTNLEMEKCELPVKKPTKKFKKLKTKKLRVHSTKADDKHAKKNEQNNSKPKPPQKKEEPREKKVKEGQVPPKMSIFDNLRERYKNAKLPPNWICGQSKSRLVFCRVKVISHGSQYEMVSDRGVAITNDCMVHVFIDGSEIILSNWKMQKVQTVEDIRKTIKAVDGFKICSGAMPGGMKSPCCSMFLTGESKTCQACKSDMSSLKVSGMKVRSNSRPPQKASSFQK